MALPVLLSPRLAAASRDLLVGDTAVDSVVYDLSLDPDALAFDPAARFVAVYRAPDGHPGDFVVYGGYADDLTASWAVANRAGRGLTIPGSALYRTDSDGKAV